MGGLKDLCKPSLTCPTWQHTYDMIDDMYIIHFCLQYFKTSLKTRLSIVYVETWEDQDQAAGISKQIDINKALDDLSSYARRKLFDVEKDTTQMFT